MLFEIRSIFAALFTIAADDYRAEVCIDLISTGYKVALINLEENYTAVRSTTVVI